MIDQESDLAGEREHLSWTTAFDCWRRRKRRRDRFRQGDHMKKQANGGRSLIASFVASALASAACVPSLTWAQDAGATLEGKAEANTEITVKNVATGLTRRTKAGADGTYAIVGLPAGTYNVDAGPGMQQVVTLNVATTETLNLEQLQTVTVSGTAQRLAEVKTSEIGTIISQQQIETVPQLTRNFLEFADTVPGMQFKVDSSGNTSLQGGAMSTSTVNVYIDGVGQKNYVKEGGVSGQFFSQGNPFPQLAIGEYKVITSNYKAEYDQISSAAITAGTKSGTNKFEGQVFGTYTGQNFRAETPSELNKVPNVKTASKDKEFGGDFGGPIIQDLMHFFVVYEGKRYTTPIAITAGSAPPAAILAQLPASVASQLGPADKSFNEDLYFGKLDWEPTNEDRFVLSAKVRRESQAGIDAGSTALSASFDTINNDKRFDLRLGAQCRPLVQRAAGHLRGLLQLTHGQCLWERCRLHLAVRRLHERQRPDDRRHRAGESPVRAEQGPEGARHRGAADLQPPAVVDRRSHGQDRHQVQVGEAHRTGCREHQPAVLLRREHAAGHGGHSVQGVLHQSGPGAESRCDFQQPAAGYLPAG